MQPDFFGQPARNSKDDLVANIHEGDRLSVAASVFSMYAYRELREQLEGLESFRLLTSPAFRSERNAKEQREFDIPASEPRAGVGGTELEIRLKTS